MLRGVGADVVIVVTGESALRSIGMSFDSPGVPSDEDGSEGGGDDGDDDDDDDEDDEDEKDGRDARAAMMRLFRTSNCTSGGSSASVASSMSVSWGLRRRYGAVARLLRGITGAWLPGHRLPQEVPATEHGMVRGRRRP